MTPTEPIEARLASALRRPMTPDQVARLDLQVAEALERQRLTMGPRLRPGRKAVLLLAALIIVPLGAAAGSIIGGGTESPHGLVDAAGYRAELEAARGMVAIPPTATWPPIELDASVDYSRSGGRRETEYVAFCLWSDAWLVAHREGDLAGERRALAGMEAYRAWKRSDVFADQTFRDYIDAVVGAAGAGRPGPVARDWALNCADS